LGPDRRGGRGRRHGNHHVRPARLILICPPRNLHRSYWGAVSGRK
jgi:hypothetical protein